jgi:hypothetical protein
MKTIIYSKENSESVKRVEEWRKKHPKFTFLELGQEEAIKEAKEKNSGNIIELDEIKVKAKSVATPEADSPTKPVNEADYLKRNSLEKKEVKAASKPKNKTKTAAVVKPKTTKPKGKSKKS